MSLTKSQFFNEINGLDQLSEQQIYERQMEQLQEQEAIESGNAVVVAKIKQLPNNEPFLPF